MKGARIWAVVAAVVLAAASVGLGQWANSAIRLGLLVGHTAVSWTAAVLPGPAAVQGTVVAPPRPLTGPFSGSPCVYYRKLVERETTDSEGRTSWSTVEDTSQHLAFELQDASGALLIDPGAAETRAPQVHQHREGDMRYTEYAIQPGHEVFAFGNWSGQQFQPADGVPFLVSALGEHQYRRGKGAQSLLACSLAILSACFAVFFLCMGCRWHHVFTYLLLLATVLPSWLFLQWFSLARSQFEFADRALLAAERHIAATPSDTIASALLKAAYNDGVERLEAYRGKLPNRVLAWSVRLRHFPQLELSSVERQHAAAFPPRPRPEVGLPIWSGVLFGGAGIVAILLFTPLAFRRLKVKRLIENLPTTPVKGVVVGATELTGTAVAEPAWLTSRYATKRCCWFKYVTKEKRGSGKNSRWVTIESGEEHVPFLLRDASGEIRVHPAQATVTGRQVLHRREGRRVKTEWLFDHSDPLYVLGTARQFDPQDDYLSIAHDGESPYLISIRSEPDIQMSFAQSGFLYLNLALIGGTITLLTFLSLTRFSPFDFFVSGLLPPCYLALLALFFMYNDLIFLKNRMQRALAMIEVAIKKRADLVPHLVDVARAYFHYERETQAALAAARTEKLASITEVQESLAAQAAGVSQWRALVEQYPELKGNQLAQQLQQRLTELENEIAFCRQSYNDAVERYNTRIGTLPDLLVAKPCGFPAADYLAPDGSGPAN